VKFKLNSEDLLEYMYIIKVPLLV